MNTDELEQQRRFGSDGWRGVPEGCHALAVQQCERMRHIVTEVQEKVSAVNVAIHY